MLQLGLFSSLAAWNKKMFRNPLTQQLFNRYATYNGSDPFQTPAVMGMIPHLEYGIGAFFPEGGMIRITESLQELALELGVEIRTGVAVDSIQTSGKKAIGIKTAQGVFDCDVLVSAVDVSLTYNRLLGKKSRAEKYSRLPKSTSAIIWYWGIGRQTPQTGLHNIFFSSDIRMNSGNFLAKKPCRMNPVFTSTFLQRKILRMPHKEKKTGLLW
jgi:phytoene dehydrogenase-like protein